MLSKTDLFFFIFGILRQLVVLGRVGAVVAKHAGVLALVHDVDVFRIQPDANGGADSGCGPYEYRYRFSTPWKYQLSTAFVIGTRGIVSFEYNMEDYSTMRYRESNYYEFDYTDYSVSKNLIKKNMQAVHTFKVGGEWRLTNRVSLRAGYAYRNSPYQEQVYDVDVRWAGMEEAIYSSSTKPNYTLLEDTEYLTCGVGYRGKGCYVDFSCMNKVQHEQVGMFPSADALYYNDEGGLSYTDDLATGAVIGTHTSMKTNTLNFDLTFGFKF